MNPEEHDAVERLDQAMRSLLCELSQEAKQWVDDVQNHLQQSLDTLSGQFLANIQHIKKELDPREAIRSDPLAWISGAVLLGIGMGILSSNGSRRQDS